MPQPPSRSPGRPSPRSSARARRTRPTRSTTLARHWPSSAGATRRSSISSARGSSRATDPRSGTRKSSAGEDMATDAVAVTSTAWTDTRTTSSDAYDAAVQILVTGAAGFIGSNFVHYWRERHPDDPVVALDLLTYAGNRANLAGTEERVPFVQADIADLDLVENVLREHQIDVVVNFAAESHNSLAVVDP